MSHAVRALEAQATVAGSDDGKFGARRPAHVRPLIDALALPERSADLDESGWDALIRLARNARLLGVLAHRVAAAVDVARLPARVQRHLEAGRLEARFRRQKTLHLLHAIVPALGGQPGPWILLKGAAYILQELPIAHGRLPSDVDLLVPRSALDGIENALLGAGWEFEKTDAYDQHYYRAWSHELPPLQAAGHALELDLHHAILPPIGRIRVDTAGMFQRAVALPASAFHVLDPLDQLLHAVVHLAQDSDFIGRLRDLLDIDGLLRALPLTDAAQAQALIERARQHGMSRPLWIAASLCQQWFATPGAAALRLQLRPGLLAALAAGRVVALGSRVIGPPDPDSGSSIGARVAGKCLELRALWLRMPPWLVAYHAAAKGVRALARTRSPE
jgi:hypothetical protein